MSVTLILCAVTGLISYQAFNNRDMFYKLMHYPYEEQRQGQYYRWISSIFVHGSWMHLLINLFVFYQFGLAVEGAFVEIFGEAMGRINFLLLYMGSGIFADLWTFLKHKDNQSFSSVGASGAVSGVLMAYVIFGPWNWLGLFFIIPVPAFAAAILYLIYSSWASKNQPGRVDHDAHFYGALFGIAFTLAIKPSLFSRFIDLLMQPYWPF